MPEIQYIKNVTVAKSFNAEPGLMTKQLTGMPDHNPDECIIRTINWNGAVDDTFMYLIWCNLTNDFIGSFCGGNIAPHFPQSRIWLTGPVPNYLEFKIYVLRDGTDQPEMYGSLDGGLAITMEFAKYKRSRDHA